MPIHLDHSVLIVDDDDLVRELLDRWLVQKGYRTLQAADAETAVVLLSSNPVGVAFCDQSMPGLGGEWLIGQIRQHFPSVAVIIATGGDVPRRVGNLPGILGHLEKPFDRVTVLGAVADAMAWHRIAARRAIP